MNMFKCFVHVHTLFKSFKIGLHFEKTRCFEPVFDLNMFKPCSRLCSGFQKHMNTLGLNLDIAVIIEIGGDETARSDPRIESSARSLFVQEPDVLLV